MNSDFSENTGKNVASVNSDAETLFQIALTLVPGIGDVIIKHLISYCGSASEIFRSKKAKLLKIPGIGEKTADAILNFSDFAKAESEVAFTKKSGTQVLFFTDKAFPQRLKQIADSPVLLFYKGNTDLNHFRILSIVGTRNATEYGREFVEKFINEVKQVNLLIVSGLAYGIDVLVHKACVENGVPTVGVMGTGINLIYPSQHKNLAMQMTTSGGLLTELRSGTKPEKQHFPARNRIVAGMADATLIVEAAKGGGALITAEIANSYNKDVFAVPGGVYSKYSEGCNNLIKDNKAHLITCADDLIKALSWDDGSRGKSISISKEIPTLEPDELIVYNLLRENSELLIDDISWKSQIPINRIASLLLNLEFQGIVKALPGKKFKLK